MTEMWSPVPSVMWEAPAGEPGAAAGGGAEGNPPTSSVSPVRADFGGINGSSNSSKQQRQRTSSGSSNSNDIGDFPALVGRPARDLEVFDELLTLQSRRTRSQSRGLTISVFCADVSAGVCHEDRGVRYDRIIARSIRRKLDDTL